MYNLNQPEAHLNSLLNQCTCPRRRHRHRPALLLPPPGLAVAEGGVDVGVVVHEAGGGRVMVVVVHPAFAGALLWKKETSNIRWRFFFKDAIKTL